jgi:hypothetical protein
MQSDSLCVEQRGCQEAFPARGEWRLLHRFLGLHQKTTTPLAFTNGVVRAD